MKPRVYNRNMQLVGILQNASSIEYTRKHNDLYTASFELPYDDPKTALCDAHYIVDIFDGETSKGKYRILDEPETDITSEGQMSKYSCEHVIAFLMNDVIDGYLEIGGTGISTETVIRNILARQTVQRWQLGTCDFNYQFQYSWENTNLLDALFSIPTCFADAYHWTFNTDTYPWTINLLEQDTDRSCEIRRKRNMVQIKREKDSSALCTRLYCKGNGEGVNQVGISEVNSGRPYIDADTINTYGVLCSHYIDLQVTDPSTLLAKGRAILEEIKHPRYTYKAKAVDLSKITGTNWFAFDEGKYVHVVDDEKGVDFDAMIIEVSKPDVDGDPLDMEITISNKSSDVSSEIEDLSKRTAITAQYSQGATNLYAQQYSDNADTAHPAVMRVYIPSECKQINKMLLSWRLSAFRAYETGAAAGGQTATTTGDGGGSQKTSSSGGQTSIVEEQKVITSAVTVSGPKGASGNDKHDTGNALNASGTEISTTGSESSHTHGMQHYHSVSSHSHSFSVSSHTHTGPSHTHSTNKHRHTKGLSSDSYTGYYNLSIDSAGTGSTGSGGSYSGTTGSGGDGNTGYGLYGGNSKSSTDSGSSHSHSFEHHHKFIHYHDVRAIVTIPSTTISIPSHTHTVDIPSHSHSVSLGNHTHSIVYGIYTGSSASGISLKVDNTSVTVPSGTSEIDIVQYLSTDSNGKITRGTWHEIEIVPDGLTRIEANLFVQTFVTSYSGGNY